MMFHIHPGDYDIDSLSVDESRQAPRGKRDFFVLKLYTVRVARLNPCRCDYKFEAVLVQIPAQIAINRNTKVRNPVLVDQENPNRPCRPTWY